MKRREKGKKHRPRRKRGAFGDIKGDVFGGEKEKTGRHKRGGKDGGWSVTKSEEHGAWGREGGDGFLEDREWQKRKNAWTGGWEEDGLTIPWGEERKKQQKQTKQERKKKTTTGGRGERDRKEGYNGTITRKRRGRENLQGELHTLKKKRKNAQERTRKRGIVPKKKWSETSCAKHFRRYRKTRKKNLSGRNHRACE